MKTRKPILAKGVVEGQLDRYWVPISARETQRRLLPGDTMKIYSLYDHEHMTDMLGKKIIVVTFKKNNNNNMNTWCFSNDEFMSFVKVTGTKHLQKLLKDAKEIEENIL
jgi:hypothetical protein